MAVFVGAGSVWQLVQDNGLTRGRALMLLPPATSQTVQQPVPPRLSQDDFLINV